MGGLPIRSIDNLNDVLYPAAGFFASRGLVLG